MSPPRSLTSVTSGSTKTPPTVTIPTAAELQALESFLALSVTSTEDPTGPEIVNGVPGGGEAASTESKPPLFAPGATLRRQRHRRVITADWRNFIATVEKNEDGTLIIPPPKDGKPVPRMCEGCGANLEDDEPHCKA